MKKIILLSLFFYSFLSYSQDSLCIKGYVIDARNIQTDVSISVLNKNISTVTNFKGKFKIPCSKGDTLVFEKKKTNYKTEKIAISDNSLLIVKLIPNVEVDKRGRSNITGSYVRKMKLKHSFIAESSTNRWPCLNIGYDYFPEPFFPDKSFIPLMNSVSVGLNLSMFENDYYCFPHLGLFVRNSYNFRAFSFGFTFPSVKLGYWINDFEPGNNGFGYELAINILSVHPQFLRSKSFLVTISYMNYIDQEGVFMLGINLNQSSVINSIPKFIKKQLPK